MSAELVNTIFTEHGFFSCTFKLPHVADFVCSGFPNKVYLNKGCGTACYVDSLSLFSGYFAILSDHVMSEKADFT